MSQAIYIITWPSGPVKVGLSGDVRRRLFSLQTASPYPLEIAYAGQIDGDAKALERRVHGFLNDHHMMREWFNVAPDVAVHALKLAAQSMGMGLMDINPSQYRKASRFRYE